MRSGRIHLLGHTTHGAQIFLQNAGSDAVLAEASAYSTRYHCDAAAEESVVAGLQKARFLSALAALPDRGRWQDVAAELGVTREALYRELARRRKKHLAKSATGPHPMW